MTQTRGSAPAALLAAAGTGGLLLAASHPALALTDKSSLTLYDAVFYTFGITATALSLAIVLAYRAYAWVNYVVFALFMLFTVASMDGTLLALSGGGDFTRWVLPYLIYTAGSAFGYWVAATNIEQAHPLARLRPALTGLAVLSLLLPLSSALWLGRIPLNLMWAPANLLFVGMLVSQCLPPLSWSDLGPRLSRFARVVPFVLCAYYAVVLFVELAAGGWGQETLNTLNRIGVLLYAAFAVTVVVSRAFASAKKQEEAERRALRLAQREAELQASLLAAERDYQRMQRLARQHQSQLAAVSHDLKQPISALRVAIDGLPADFTNRERFYQAVDYIGSLAHEFLEHEHDNCDAESDASGRELVATSVFVASLRQMFEDDAERDGLRLRIHGGRHEVFVQPLRTMRILSNLLGNALAHARARRIVVGFRPRGSGVLFQIIDDGVGMAPEFLARIYQRGARGDDSEGHGLGLAIVKELCDEQGLGFELESRPGKGTTACVLLPAPNTLAAR
ncbi:MAG: HAMP domain-containing sensor histidine kinase [Halieaceae bacterium]|jgi:signal transduction histidine kinase|nr:HAMP domain-containing sensor histidine kinase [Halieaceae bacterium]